MVPYLSDRCPVGRHHQGAHRFGRGHDDRATGCEPRRSGLDGRRHEWTARAARARACAREDLLVFLSFLKFY